MADNGTQSGGGRRPVLAVLTSHWLSVLGASLVTIAACSWLFLLPMHIAGQAGNPYAGILIFFAIPVVFFVGLALIPVGAFLARRRIRAGLAAAPDRRVTLRRLALFFGLMTIANVIIASQVSYRAVAQMEGVQFCGQTCHVMKPQFVAYQRSPHRNVRCVDCHVVPGGAGFVQAKMNGTRQMIEVAMGTYPKPVPPALETNRLPSSAETCEQCHSRAIESGSRLRVEWGFNDDEANTPVQTVLMMHVGGGRSGGIHGAHMGPGVVIRYRAADKGRSNIPWVEYRNSATGEASAYLETGAKDPGGETYVMECADCHNSPGHAFELPAAAVEGAMAAGRIPMNLPFAHKTGVQVISASYTNDQEAAAKIPQAFAASYQQKYPDVFARQGAEIGNAGQALAELYRANVYHDLGVKWGTYPDNLGHNDSRGCFRCHDASHSTAAKPQKTITQDCNVCHQVLAVQEKSPEVLKTLGLMPGNTTP
jgi:hypothetical protein